MGPTGCLTAAGDSGSIGTPGVRVDRAGQPGSATLYAMRSDGGEPEALAAAGRRQLAQIADGASIRRVGSWLVVFHGHASADLRRSVARCARGQPNQ